jgi:hypothetical protein
MVPCRHSTDFFLHAWEDTREVYGHDFVPDIIRIFGCGSPNPSDAGTVDRALQFSKHFERERNGRPDAFGISHIHADKRRAGLSKVLDIRNQDPGSGSR